MSDLALGHLPVDSPGTGERRPCAFTQSGEPTPLWERTGAVFVRGLTITYDRTDVVAGIDLDVYQGEVFALLGPNGAGKTSTIETLEGFRRPAAGQVRVLGIDPQHADRAWRERIGVVLQESTPEPELTVAECLALYAGYYRRPRPVAEVLRLVGLEQQASSRYARLSGGQRRRLDVALALIGDPDLVFLDEPTTGFDPVARRAAWDMIGGLRDLGKTVVLTTHYMDEAERLADRIAVIVGGRLVAQGTPAALGGRDRDPATIRFALPSDVAMATLPPLVGAALTESVGCMVEARTDRPLAFLGALAAWAIPRGVDVDDLRVSRPSLEETYLRLTEQSA